jgi:ATP-binding protein involved in chromosome partitioning
MQLDGAVLVTTPQDIARIDTAKALAMFQAAGVPVLGLVQNMDGFLCPHCGERVDIFPRSQEARSLLDDLPLLGRIPLDPGAAVSGDKGQPVVISKPESAVAAALTAMADRVVDRLAAMRAQEGPPSSFEDDEDSERGGRPETQQKASHEEKTRDEGKD